MNNYPIRISKLERKYVNEVLNTQFSSSSGAQFMRRLERAFSSRYKNYNSISFINGTATMHAALEAAGIGEGDEVLVPPLTMASTTFSVLQCNATPIFTDVDEKTFQICPSDIIKKITSRTKAIITVALFGGSPKLDKIRKICDNHSLFMLEDNAECFGGHYNGLPVGCYGDASSFSFQSSKHLTSGEGGILLVKDTEMADRVRSFQSLGYAGLGANSAQIDKSTIQKPDYKRHDSFGSNYRMPELCAAVALGQVERMDDLITPRLRMAKAFNSIAAQFPSILTPQKNYSSAINTYWTWACKLNFGIDWNIFKKLYVTNGGDPFYGAWSLTFDEPFVREMVCYGRDKYLTDFGKKNWKDPSCPVASDIQPRLCQFQTNISDEQHLERQAEALSRTLEELHG